MLLGFFLILLYVYRNHILLSPEIEPKAALIMRAYEVVTYTAQTPI